MHVSDVPSAFKGFPMEPAQPFNSTPHICNIFDVSHYSVLMNGASSQLYIDASSPASELASSEKINPTLKSPPHVPQVPPEYPEPPEHSHCPPPQCYGRPFSPQASMRPGYSSVRNFTEANFFFNLDGVSMGSTTDSSRFVDAQLLRKPNGKR